VWTNSKKTTSQHKHAAPYARFTAAIALLGLPLEYQLRALFSWTTIYRLIVRRSMFTFNPRIELFNFSLTKI
jgi:hypothetical protein